MAEWLIHKEMHLMGRERSPPPRSLECHGAQAILENQKLALSMMQSFWFPGCAQLGVQPAERTPR
jgi:hypothetical protein